MQLGRFTDEDARRRFTALYAEAMRRWPTHDRLDVDTSYGPTAVHRAGPTRSPAAPVVLLHGGGATSASWAPLVPALAEHRPVLAVDTLGDAGGSVQRAPVAGPADRARWLDEVLAGLDEHRVQLVGGSYGGWLALNQAVHRPQRLVSVAALDPPGALVPIGAGFTWRLLVLHAARSPAAVHRFLAWARGGRPVTPQLRDLLASAVLDHRSRISAPRRLADTQLAGIPVPTLVLLGAESPVHDVRRAAVRARALLGDGQVEVVPGAAHGMVADRPEAVTELLAGFLDRVDPVRR